jgi:hypothetical protein
MKNIFDKLSDAFDAFVEQKPPAVSKVTIAEIIKRKSSMVLFNGKLYRVTAEEVEAAKKS